MNELTLIEQNNQRVLLTSQLAEMYGTDERRISENYARNTKRYIEGTDFMCLEGEVLKAFKNEYANCGIAPTVNKLYLWTEHGALLHAKSLGTDEAWKKYGVLVDTYFAVQSGEVSAKKVKAPKDAEAAKLRADAMKMNAATRRAKFLREQMVEAGIDPKHRLISIANSYNSDGFPVSLPPMEVDYKTYDLTEMAKALGVLSKNGIPHSQAIGYIVRCVKPTPEEIVHVPFDKNGHAADSDRYKEPVLHRVKQWLSENGYPCPIVGDVKKYAVTYADR